MPGSAVLLAATQGVVPTLGGVESVLDSNVAVSGGTTRRAANGFTLPGENILAIQYRQVDFAWFRKPSPRNMSLSNRSKWKAYLGSRGEDSDIGSDEDSMEEDEDTEAAFVMLQAVIGDDIDAADLGEFSTYQDYALDDTEALWLVS
ncbi:hypothetical protein DL768_010102 [Monosporascus sp. mg162]|nr:hypothetical protein DL768_010102 [Monosporascus sp. mg162]